MSFILESIKQAERERKLGQQVPSISIEYSSAHVEDVENNKMKWVIVSLVLLGTAIIVWGATQYFANKDRQYIEQYVEETGFNKERDQEEALFENISTEKTINIPSSNSNKVSEKHDVLMVPVKNVHKSDLKSVKVISANEEAPKTKIERAVEVKKLVVNKATNVSTSKNSTRERTPSIGKFQPKLEASSTVSTVAGKEELADIYSDLSKLAKQESSIKELKFIEPEVFEQKDIDEKLVQIEAASYVAPNVNAVAKETKYESKIRTEVPSLAPKHAVRTGVPSFGELPYEIQEKIPDINVSVHMFHADPNQRRIRINGSMYTEGKSLQQDLALVEITRYGAVFDYQGHKFRLNVR